MDAPVIQYLQNRPRNASQSLNSIISKSPENDIMMLIYFISFIGLPYFGFNYFWTVAAVHSVSMIMKDNVEEPRPVDVFPRLRPLAKGGGLPSIESAYSGVVCLYMACGFSNIGIKLSFVLLTLLVGATRVYAYSHFAHQVVAGWLLAAVTVVISLILQGLEIKYVMSGVGNWVGFGLINLGVLTTFALRAENSTSDALRIPREEYMRVIGNILEQPTENVDEDEEHEVVGEEEWYGKGGEWYSSSSEDDSDASDSSEEEDEEEAGGGGEGGSSDGESSVPSAFSSRADRPLQPIKKAAAPQFPLFRRPRGIKENNPAGSNRKDSLRKKPDSFGKLMRTMEKRVNQEPIDNTNL